MPILLISGPSGSGKSSLIKRLFAEFDNLYFSISSTTRAPREGEKDGVNYYFISKEEFEKGIANGEFLEWACVHNNFYGTNLHPVKAALDAGKVVVFDIDVQGFELANKHYKDEITSVFLTTKDAQTLQERLSARGDESAQSIQSRVANAKAEVAKAKQYDFIIVNEDLDESYAKLRAIFLAMHSRVKHADLDEILGAW